MSDDQNLHDTTAPKTISQTGVIKKIILYLKAQKINGKNHWTDQRHPTYLKFTILYLVYFLSMFQERQYCLNWSLFKQLASRGTLWDLVYNFNNSINHIFIKIMTLNFRLWIEDDLCQSSWSRICVRNPDWPTEERTPRCSFLVTACCFQNTGQTLALLTARIKQRPKATVHGNTEMNSN